MIKHRETKTLNDFHVCDKRYDMLICSASFEERCLTVASSINKDAIDFAIVCRYNGYAQLSEHYNSMLLETLGNIAMAVSLDKDHPLSIYDTLHDIIIEKHPKSVLLDISTFTRETILIALMLFKQDAFKDIDVTLCYVPADRYSTSNNNEVNAVSEIWLSKGVNEIRTVLGYAGSFTSLKKTLLIVLVGFEKERAEILINRFEADKLYLGYVPPQESHNETLSEINIANFNRLVSIVGDCNTVEFSCRYIDKTYSALKDIIESNKEEYNIIISPMNNKISTLAVANVAFEYPEVQVCYASTNQYNTEAYSSAADKVVLFDFQQPLSRIKGSGPSDMCGRC